ncbi:MAG: hypothetical protein KIS66_17550 [Fimbriimonadaceae bacterium]|nr:hypothetical protein [Fimbriimonadaceae bacterium]
MIPDLSHALWKEAIEHYYWDRLDRAYEIASTQGLGQMGAYLSWFRMIEAEWLTRRDGERLKVEPWLELEWSPGDVGYADMRPIGEAVRAACDEVAQRLGWTHGASTLVSILREEARAPWSIAADGYCVDMHPYEKICLPRYALEDRIDFRRVVRHEYAHVVTINLAAGTAPRWLSEAVSVLLEGGRDRATERAFRDGSAQWLDPDPLEKSFSAEDRSRVWLAYRQSGLIGGYLASLEGELRVGDLLRAHAEGSFWKRLGAGFLGATHTDVAMRRTYGRSVSQVFSEALAWLRSGRPVG